jgi:hypothetical protein
MKAKTAIVIVAIVAIAGFLGWRQLNSWNMENAQTFDSHLQRKYTVWRDIDPQTKERVWVAQDEHGRKATSTVMPLLAIQDLEKSRQTIQFSPEGGSKGDTGK